MEVGQKQKSIEFSEIISSIFTLSQQMSGNTDTLFLHTHLPELLLETFSCHALYLYCWSDDALRLAGSAEEQRSNAIAEEHDHIQRDALAQRCWRERHSLEEMLSHSRHHALWLHVGQQAIGVMLVVCRQESLAGWEACRSDNTVKGLEVVASIVAFLLEQARQRASDRERMKELSLLNSISRQMNSVPYEVERVRTIVLQRIKEITNADFCALLEPTGALAADNGLTREVRDRLFQEIRQQQTHMPIMRERQNQRYTIETDYFTLLPEGMQTFFAFPLLSGRGQSGMRMMSQGDAEGTPNVLGCIIGGYRDVQKMSQSQVTLLHMLANQAGSVLENVRLLEDVVEARNQAHKLLKQVLDDQRLKELILSTMPGGLITTDQHGCIQTFNHAAETILGYQAYDVITTPLQNLVHVTIPPFWLHAEHTVDARGTAESINWHKQTIACSDRYNREVVLDVDIRPFYDEIRNQPGLLVMFSDVTLVHRLEDEKRHLDHLASLGEMAASVAHEVRNPLASIKMSMQLLRDELIGGDDEGQGAWMQESIVVVLKEVERLDAIVRDLLLFAKPHQLHRSSCEIAHVIEHVLRVVGSQCREHQIEVQHAYDPLPQIWVDSAQMEQVLLNIVINALQAMPEGGMLSVSCHLLSTEQAIFDTAGSSCPPTQRPSGSSGTAISAYAWLIDKHATQKEFRVQHWLEVLVSDTGIGIAPEQLQHIFQPFYTTKAHGIGLGLAITRRLVEDHGGYLRIESQTNYGTTVAVRIPFVTEANLYAVGQASENNGRNYVGSMEEIERI